MLPVVDHKPKYIGRVGKELDTKAGRDAAYTAALGVLAAAKQHLGSLDRVTRVVRLGVFIATSEDYVDHPKVADAVSDLFRDIFGIEKTSVRVIVGAASLPLGVPIELDVIFEVTD
jgi:enamine deaminase RidA (YjgF/YER057c/UK114 family)